MEEIEILKELKVDPSALVWVHAQVETDRSLHKQAARMGTWVSLDGITNDFDNYVEAITKLKEAGYLHRVLISHDAGYYRPGEINGGNFTAYTAIFKELVPRLVQKGFTEKDIRQLLEKNPAQALQLRIRKFRGA